MKIHEITSPVEALLALPYIESIERYYPNLKDWYVNTVVSDLNNTSNVILALKDGNVIKGIGLGKGGVESKLRCIRVDPSIQYTGAGIKLMDSVIEKIQCDKPHCTVAEELFHDYSRVFVKRYAFTLSDVVKGAYRKNKLEYYFN